MPSCHQFLRIVERIVHSAVRENYPRDWDEDFITRSLLKSLRRAFARGSRIQFNDLLALHLGITPVFLSDLCCRYVIDGLAVEWDLYKLTGKRENKFGDVAIFVASRHPDGDKNEGVAFLEAKRRYKNGREFRAISFHQLKRIIAHAPRASVLLYDFVPTCGYCGCTWAVTVPMDLVIAARRKDTSLYKFSAPFSVRLLTHLLGFCLERAEEPLKIAKGYLMGYGAPLYLLLLRVGIGTEPPRRDAVDVNLDLFGPLPEESPS